MKTKEIQIRDPYILPDDATQTYYLFGTTDPDCWKGAGTGFDCYSSRNLEDWEGPVAAFRPPAGFWATTNFWAPEVHAYQGRYYLFATFKAPDRYRGTQILVADRPEGPYREHSQGPVTPAHWECLDGTLHVDEAGEPWIVFCHEWAQIHNGSICALRLREELSASVGRPVFLFNATDAPWVRAMNIPGVTDRRPFPCYVTDGPFLHRHANGCLYMLWSSMGDHGYTMGLACSASGTLTGGWEQLPPLWTEDGGHGMLFRTFSGQLMMTFHQPNDTPNERPVFHSLEETPDGFALG